MDLSRICRVCLEDNEQSFDIFTSYYLKWNTLYSDMLASCTKLKPYLEDGLPRNICKVCIRHLKQTYTFNNLCEESDKKLRNLIENKPLVILFPSEGADIKNESLQYNDLSEKSAKVNKNNETNDKLFDIINSGVDIKEDIKNEPNDVDDGENSCWDAEDDYLALGDIKKQQELLDQKEPVIVETKPRKKRTRQINVKDHADVKKVSVSKLPHQCDICGKVLSTRSNLKAHKLCHSDLRPYQCGECTASFRGYSALFQHKKIHSGDAPYHCEYCPKQFRRRTSLVNHIRMHTGEKLFSCDICYKTFVQSAQLSIHLKRHQGEKPFLCQDCGKGFPIKSDLKVHQRIHNGEKPYACHLCTKTFTTSGNLSIHVRIHNKEIRYNCKECGRGFVTCSAFKVHLKRHMGQRDYHCDCGKMFFTSSALKQHRVVHTGEKPYQCKICERKFTQTSHLSRHFKRDHAKLNAPVPPSDQYKVIVDSVEAATKLFTMPEQKNSVNSSVKCKGHL